MKVILCRPIPRLTRARKTRIEPLVGDPLLGDEVGEFCRRQKGQFCRGEQRRASLVLQMQNLARAISFVLETHAMHGVINQCEKHARFWRMFIVVFLDSEASYDPV
jgi:hypothetical protein